MPEAHDPTDAKNRNAYRLLQAVRRILRQVSAHSRHLSKETGLTVPQLLCVRAIDEIDADEVTVAALAQAVQLSASTVSGVVERLVQAGVVHRARSTRDRRRVCLSLTERGSELLAQSPTPLQDAFIQRMADLGPEEQEQLLSAVERVVELMDAGDLDASPILVAGVDVDPK